MQMSVACNLIPMGDRLDSDPTVDFLDKEVVAFDVVTCAKRIWLG